MSVDPGTTVSLLTALPALVRRAGTAQEALIKLVDTLRSSIPSLWRASILKLLPLERQLVYVALWSVVESQLAPGVHVSVVATVFPEVQKLDRPVLSSEHSDSPLLLVQIVASEGVASWASIPLHRDGHIVGLLSFSSLEADAFRAGDLAFFEQLGKGVEKKLVDLM
jgi:transcriptional regulator with GAF, ATPase, and Fis domain